MRDEIPPGEMRDPRENQNGLVKSEQLFRVIFENAADGILLADSRGRKFLLGNKQICKALGYGPDEIKNLGVRDIHPEKDLPHVIDQFERLMRNKMAVARDIPVKRKDGSIYYADISALPITLEGRTCLVGIFRDITERKQTEDALRKNEEKYRRIVDTANEGIWIFDENLVTTFANARLAEMLGYRMDEIIGRTFSTFLFEEDLPDHEMKMAERKRGLEGHYERRFRNKDGHTVWTLISATPILDSEHHFQGGFAMLTDITARKLKEEELARLKAILDNTSDLVGLSLLDGMCLYLNAAGRRMAGFGSDEDLSRYHMSDIHPAWAWQIVEEEGLPAAIAQGVWEGETAIVSRDGMERPVSQVIIAQRSQDGSIEYLSTIMRDIAERKRMEAALEKSEKLLNAAQQLSKVGGWEWDIEKQTMTWTDETYRIHDMTPEHIDPGSSPEHIKMSSACYPPEVRSAVLEAFRRCAEQGIPYDMEMPFTSTRGRTMWVRTMAEAVRSGDRIVKVVGNIMDITERKKAEEALVQSKQTAESYLNIAAEIILSLDDQGNIMLLNESGHRLLGYDPGYLRGKNWFDICLPEESRNEVRKLFAKLREGNDTDIESHENRVITRNGEERTILWHNSILRDRDNTFMGTLSSGEDITERKRMEDALRESEVRFRSLIQNSLDIIVMADENGCITYETPSVEQKLGYPSGYLIGRDPLDFIHPGDRERVKHDLLEVYEHTNPGTPTEFRFRGADGRWIPLEAVGNNLIGYPGINSIVLTARDITERKKAEVERKRLENRLTQAQKMELIGTFAGGIAHDFNNILSAIIGFAELAMNDLSDPAKVQNDLNGVLRAGNRAKELVAQIITFSRHGDAKCVPTMLEDTVRESFKLLRSIIPSSIEIRQKYLSSGLVLADRLQVRQMIMNLCSNAVQAIGEAGGVLEVSLERVSIAEKGEALEPDLAPGKYVRITISDTGHGMDQDVRNRIFDPYFTTREQGKGSGLGLSVVQGIVRKHRGVITCRSIPGEGTAFHIYFPEIESGEEQPGRLEAAEPAGETPRITGEGKILFIDDDPTLAYLADELLGGLGYKVVTKTSSVEALNYFQESPDQFDLVITDMTMPVMTGDRLAQRILEIRSDIPVILCTGYNEYISREKSERIGICELVMKPFEMADLDAIIQRVLNRGGKIPQAG